MKEVFTTGEAAKICRVSQQTIIRCFDAGNFKKQGFRVPGSRFRRITRKGLCTFMEENGFPPDMIPPNDTEQSQETTAMTNPNTGIERA